MAETPIKAAAALKDLFFLGDVKNKARERLNFFGVQKQLIDILGVRPQQALNSGLFTDEMFNKVGAAQIPLSRRAPSGVAIFASREKVMLQLLQLQSSSRPPPSSCSYPKLTPASEHHLYGSDCFQEHPEFAALIKSEFKAFKELLVSQRGQGWGWEGGRGEEIGTTGWVDVGVNKYEALVLGVISGKFGVGGAKVPSESDQPLS
ncbi:hypothetical protein BDK51DRAFT_32607 [Blyttiomyces helicus]|uniref:Uncharacterized protein n=1 Tax=Blyttiomyces helicus TaxID=388810 RepID=A0A4P9W793_9FUNG|nr:hypothetical protein BDK51DRAFT_32607 [Blyttiomyces helicus]|eukprot:RKO87932.1 hypothetical protein BDK51DRAFT_32607 [Blyttiomyces helicus]